MNLPINNIDNFQLLSFVGESNRIEGLWDIREQDMRATSKFLGDTVSVDALCSFVQTVQPGARLRDAPGLDVRVGGYTPPPGGPWVQARLEALLTSLPYMTPWEAHVAYEKAIVYLTNPTITA